MYKGYTVNGIDFLKDLKENNNREWFHENKNIYRKYVEKPSKELFEEILFRLPEVTKKPVSGKIFRIYRDVRFSKDKTPYKTNVRMCFYCSGGDMSGCGSKPNFYFSLEPDNIIIGLGNHEFSKESLELYRHSIDDDKKGKQLKKISASFASKDNYRINEPKLKRVPSGFDKDHPRSDLLRHKGFSVWYDKNNPDLTNPDLADYILDKFKDMKPVYNWLISM